MLAELEALGRRVAGQRRELQAARRATEGARRAAEAAAAGAAEAKRAENAKRLAAQQVEMVTQEKQEALFSSAAPLTPPKEGSFFWPTVDMILIVKQAPPLFFLVLLFLTPLQAFARQLEGDVDRLRAKDEALQGEAERLARRRGDATAAAQREGVAALRRERESLVRRTTTTRATRANGSDLPPTYHNYRIRMRLMFVILFRGFAPRCREHRAMFELRSTLP